MASRIRRITLVSAPGTMATAHAGGGYGYAATGATPPAGIAAALDRALASMRLPGALLSELTFTL